MPTSNWILIIELAAACMAGVAVASVWWYYIAQNLDDEIERLEGELSLYEMLADKEDQIDEAALDAAADRMEGRKKDADA